MRRDGRDEPVGVVVVGCGDIAVTQHLPAIAECADTRLTAVVDSDPGRRASAADRYGVPGHATLVAAMATGPTAAVVATPPEATPTLVREALTHDLHVLCEKPMAVDVPAGIGVRDAARAAGTVVQVGFSNRFSPLVERLHELVRDGALGDPLVYLLGAYDERLTDDRRHLGRMTHFLEHGPAFVHEGAHLTDYVRHLAGCEARRVAAVGSRSSPGFPAANFTAAVVELDNGDVARLEVGWLYPALPRGHIRVLGPRATAEVDRRSGTLVVDDGENQERQVLDGDWMTVSFRRQLNRFVAAVRGDAAGIPTPDDGVASLALSAAVVRAMDEGRAVEPFEVGTGT